MKERGGPAGVIQKTDICSTRDIHRVDMTFSVTKVFFLQQQDWHRQRSYKSVNDSLKIMFGMEL
jgi:hypothetical protein